MRTFAIFAKYWEKGQVKTRLAKSIGDQNAARIYFQFLRQSLEIANHIDLPGIEKVIGFSPNVRRSDFEQLAPTWRLIPQTGQDLGSRMKSFFDQLFHTQMENKIAAPDSGTHEILLIGSDTPLLPPSTIKLAFKALEKNEIVIGPSPDGGYYLVGAKTQTPLIFDNVNWGSDQVLSQTLRNIHSQGYRYELLNEHSDVDELDDLQRVVHELTQKKNRSQLENELLQIVDSVFNETGMLPGKTSRPPLTEEQP
ncbi:MAG: TIGR04282 family arsenosugar biosynthesis glycosyltransferase [Planctomycetota bacterium]|nr:TIGR04282 family arsenosugar biosynthesis glycosyltransferase [Planctomycetota bacterium]